MELTSLEWKVLRACAGEIVRGLPYDDHQRAASAKLKALGLIYNTYEDDQPTSYATDKGRAALNEAEGK